MTNTEQNQCSMFRLKKFEDRQFNYLNTELDLYTMFS